MSASREGTSTRIQGGRPDNGSHGPGGEAFVPVSMLDQVSDAVISCDERVVITSWNAAAETVYGWTAQEALGRHADELLATEFADGEHQRVVDTLEESGHWHGELVQRRADGSTVHVDSTITRLTDERGRVTGSWRVNRDLGERAVAERAREQAVAVLQATLESTADGVLVVGEAGETLFANGRFAELWLIPDDLLATRDDEAMLSFVLDQLEDPHAFVAKVHELYRSEVESFDTLRFKDGRVFERFSRALSGDGGVTGRVWSFRDITDRRRAEERLREAESRYRTLVEQVPAVTYVDSLHGPDSTVYISPQIELMLGYTPEEWRADPHLWDKIMHPDDRDRELEASNEHHRTAGRYLGEYRAYTKWGELRWFRDEAMVLTDEDGKAVACHGVLYDITERVEAEQALRHALDRERVASDQLRALDDMKNTFLNAVSHELRTPLTSILGTALTLNRSAARLSPEDTADLIERLATNARKLDRLLSDLLDLDRLRRGLIEARRRPVDVGALTRSTVEQFDAIADRSIAVDAPSLLAHVEPAKVERIVENLVANSVRHTPAGTPIWVRVSPADDRGVLIVVEDAGPGVPEDLRDSIFEPFGQAPAVGHGSSPGVGIGLSLVARFAELHGGRAWVEDREGGGASFRVLLPPAP